VPGGWRLEVADNGIGIPEHELPRIFGMFERVDRSRYPGFGIGLASVRQIAELHGGRVTVSSQVGVGSRFAVLLTDRRA
jgi:signal transduction histidine kinase